MYSAPIAVRLLETPLWQAKSSADAPSRASCYIGYSNSHHTQASARKRNRYPVSPLSSLPITESRCHVRLHHQIREPSDISRQRMLQAKSNAKKESTGARSTHTVLVYMSLHAFAFLWFNTPLISSAENLLMKTGMTHWNARDAMVCQQVIPEAPCAAMPSSVITPSNSVTPSFILSCHLSNSSPR